MSGKSDYRSQSKTIIYNVYSYLKDLVNNRPNATIREVFQSTQEATANACSCNVRTVQRICAEARTSATAVVDDQQPKISFKSPNKKKIPHQKWVTGLDKFNQDCVRRTINEFYNRGEYPTSVKVREILHEKIEYSGSTTSTWRILRNLGYKYKKCNDGRRFLMERNDIILSRITFLRKMHNLRKEKYPRPIIYIDETWVNQNHARNYVWQDCKCVSGIPVPTGKGSRFVICHAGSSDRGFIEGAELVFQTKNSGDYHDQMNGEIFREWFVELLRSLDEGCVLVMDNASYHSKLLEKTPNTKSKKADILAWLETKKIHHDPTLTVRELLQEVKIHKRKFERYELDNIATEMGHEVIRLPPYHCQYNPIELIWAKVKGATHNKTFKIQDLKKLIHDTLKQVTVEDWRNCVRHAEKQQEVDFNKEVCRDNDVDPIIINLNSDESSDDCTSDSEEF